MTSIVLRNATLLDVETGEYAESDLLIIDGRIDEVTRRVRAPEATRELDVAGAVVMPGLIDAHVHITSATADLGELTKWSPAFVAAHAIQIMGGMLTRGFTTVRDCGGADYGFAAAQQAGIIRGPRINFCGRALSQTGGHGDFRAPGDDARDDHPSCVGSDVVVDGVDGVRVSARRELRRGAHFLKVMAGGGVASPTDDIGSTQYSIAELRAVVEEAGAVNRYVAAHAYTPRAVSRALEAGARSIEHGNLITDENVKEFLAFDAYLVPTLVTYWALKNEGHENNLPAASARKVDTVLTGGLAALERAHRAGVKLAFGSDLLGRMHRHQNKEFSIRREVQQPLDIIRSATSVAAELLGMQGTIGTLRPGSNADLIVLKGDPLADINVLADPSNIDVVIQGGCLPNEARL